MFLDLPFKMGYMVRFTTCWNSWEDLEWHVFVYWSLKFIWGQRCQSDRGLTRSLSRSHSLVSRAGSCSGGYHPLEKPFHSCSADLWGKSGKIGIIITGQEINVFIYWPQRLVDSRIWVNFACQIYIHYLKNKGCLPDQVAGRKDKYTSRKPKFISIRQATGVNLLPLTLIQLKHDKVKRQFNHFWQIQSD